MPETGLSLSAPPEELLAARLRALGLHDVSRIRTHQNRTVMVSLTSQGELRVHREYAVAPEQSAFPVPDGVNDNAALGIVVQGLSAWQGTRDCIGRTFQPEGRGSAARSVASGTDPHQCVHQKTRTKRHQKALRRRRYS